MRCSDKFGETLATAQAAQRENIPPEPCHQSNTPPCTRQKQSEPEHKHKGERARQTSPHQTIDQKRNPALEANDSAIAESKHKRTEEIQVTPKHAVDQTRCPESVSVSYNIAERNHQKKKERKMMPPATTSTPYPLGWLIAMEHMPRPSAGADPSNDTKNIKKEACFCY